MNDSSNRDWLKHPIFQAIGLAGQWGLYVTLATIVVIGLLEFVDARNERIWWIALWVGGVAAAAWAASFAIVIVASMMEWLFASRK